MKYGLSVFITVLCCIVCGTNISFAQSTDATAITPTVAPTVAPSIKPTATQSATPTPPAKLPAPPATKPTSTANTTATVTKGKVTLPPEKAEPVRIPRFETPPVIDGKFDDAVWQHAAVFRDFYQVQPGDNIAPSQKTEVLMGYDSRNLYIAFRAFDDPGKVRSTISKRDQIFDDDHVGIFLDTFNDQRKAYEFFFNPLGIQADAVYTEKTNGDREDFSVDVVMESKGVMTENGYTVEVAMPFKSIRYEAGDGKLWGIHLLRRIKRENNELDSWMPLSRDISGTLNQTGHINGLAGIAAERTLELIPSITISETGRRNHLFLTSDYNANNNLLDPGHFVNKPITGELGLTGKYSITPNIILDFAVNPDFAQVESDQTVVTANQRFPIFYPEKRPFFLEGKDIFETQIRAVNTRTIISPDFAAKLTGKRGRNTFGVLLAVDSGPGVFDDDERDDILDQARHSGKPPLFLDSFNRVFNKKAYVGILRLKRDIGNKDSNIGFLATSYDFGDEPQRNATPYTGFERGVRHSKLAGFDGRFRINPKTIFTFQVLGTKTRRYFYDPDKNANIYRTGNGFAYDFNLDNTGRNFGYTLGAQGRTQDYRADVGFTRRRNTNSDFAGFRYSTNPNPKRTLIEFRVRNGNSVNYDFQGRLQHAESNVQAQFRLKHETFALIGYERGYDRIFEEEFGARRKPATLTEDARQGAFYGNSSERSTHFNVFYGYAETTISKKYGGSLFIGNQRGIFDFDFGGGARFPRVSPAALLGSGQLNPGAGNQFDVEANMFYKPTDSLSFSMGYNKSKLRRVDTELVAFDDNIISFRSRYQFSRFTFARLRIDYDTLAASVRSQMLLAYTPNPGTAFYVGYNDDLNYRGYNPLNPNLNIFEPGLRRNNRTFFIKASYLIRRNLGKKT